MKKKEKECQASKSCLPFILHPGTFGKHKTPLPGSLVLFMFVKYALVFPGMNLLPAVSQQLPSLYIL